jgi:hypothetical protein
MKQKSEEHLQSQVVKLKAEKLMFKFRLMGRIKIVGKQVKSLVS